MEIKFNYTFADYEAINRSRRRRRKFAKARDVSLIVLIVANFGFGIAIIIFNLKNGIALSWLSFANILIGFAIIFGILVLGPLHRKWYLKQQMIENEEVTLEFHDKHIVANFGENRTQTKWGGIIEADEDPTHFLLWINKMQAYSIPKTAFEAGQEKKFRNLVVNTVENRTFDI